MSELEMMDYFKEVLYCDLIEKIEDKKVLLWEFAMFGFTGSIESKDLHYMAEIIYRCHHFPRFQSMGISVRASIHDMTKGYKEFFKYIKSQIISANEGIECIHCIGEVVEVGDK